jgi:hypothetical protein
VLLLNLAWDARVKGCDVFLRGKTLTGLLEDKVIKNKWRWSLWETRADLFSSFERFHDQQMIGVRVNDMMYEERMNSEYRHAQTSV